MIRMLAIFATALALLWDHTRPIIVEADFRMEPNAGRDEEFCGLALLADEYHYGEVFSWRQDGAGGQPWLGLFINEGYRVGSFGYDPGGWHRGSVEWRAR